MTMHVLGQQSVNPSASSGDWDCAGDSSGALDMIKEQYEPNKDTNTVRVQLCDICLNTQLCAAVLYELFVLDR